jgi:homocysteine S-methyltransferase
MYRDHLPLLGGRHFLSDGGMETTLIFQEGVDLPHFASFVLLASDEGRARLKAYYQRYLTIARRQGCGFVLDTPTWRANPDWGARLGYDAAALGDVNESAVSLLEELREHWQTPATPCVVSGTIGPRGDGYRGDAMTAEEAQAYHTPQIASFAGTTADMVGAYTLTNAAEATGITRAAQHAGIPCSISFTVETDGRLPDGQGLGEAIEQVDRDTGEGPVYYMINCAHPTHFQGALQPGAGWSNRLFGIRANASTRSHAELDEADTLDPGDPADLARRYSEIVALLPGLRLFGGCCGTDDRHVAAICEACIPAASQA